VTKIGYDALAEGDFHYFIKFFTGTSTFFGCTKTSELKEYLDKFDSLIDPEKSALLKIFATERTLDRIIRPFTNAKWVISMLPLGALPNSKSFVFKSE